MKLLCLKRTITQKDKIIIHLVCVMCNVSRGRVLQLTAMAYGICIAQVGRRARSKMWEFEVLMRDSGMSGVFAGYSSKKR